MHLRTTENWKKVVIGSQVTKIGANAFSGAKNLKTITIKSKSSEERWKECI